MEIINLKFILRAFKYRNYRLYFAGQSISLVGTWMQMIAVAWLVYRMTNSAVLLGAVAFIGQIPTLILSPFAGVLADRFNRRNMIIAAEILSMLQAFILAFLTLTNNIAVWHIFALSLFLGLISSFEIPSRQAFVVDIVEKREDLGNAIALNSSMFNGARLVGPAMAGIIIASFGEGICFLLNGLSFLAVIFVLLMIKVDLKKIQPKKEHFLKGLKDGFSYAFGFAPIKYILFLVSLVSLTGMSYAILMPIFAKEILKGGPMTLGFLMGASGIGALCGTIYLAAWRHPRGLEKIVSKATFLFGAGLIAFSFSRHLWLCLLLMLFVGFGMIIQMASGNTILQALTDDDKRGRVMSIFAMAFLGMSPFGSLLAGFLASRIGAANVLFLSGLSLMLGAFLFSRKDHCYEKYWQ